MKSLIAFCFLYLLTSISARTGFAESEHISRAAFTVQMAKVKTGMTQQQVRALLGPPDVTLNREGKGRAWLYGATPKFHCPSLGTVEFDKGDKVEHTIGGEGSPPPDIVISEKQLRDLLDLIDGLAPLGPDFDPLACIKAVNTLWLYGRDRTLMVTREYRRVCPAKQESVVYLLRLLFESPDDPIFLPEAYDGLHDPRTEELHKWRATDYPVVRWSRTPLCLVTGTYSSSDDYVSQVISDAEGREFRKRPLEPAYDPLWVFYEYYRIIGSGQSLFGPGDEDQARRQILRRQMLKLIRAVIPESSPYHAFTRPGARTISPDEFSHLRRDLMIAGCPFRWNPVHNEYESIK